MTPPQRRTGPDDDPGAGARGRYVPGPRSGSDPLTDTGAHDTGGYETGGYDSGGYDTYDTGGYETGGYDTEGGPLTEGGRRRRRGTSPDEVGLPDGVRPEDVDKFSGFNVPRSETQGTGRFPGSRGRRPDETPTSPTPPTPPTPSTPSTPSVSGPPASGPPADATDDKARRRRGTDPGDVGPPSSRFSGFQPRTEREGGGGGRFSGFRASRGGDGVPGPRNPDGGGPPAGGLRAGAARLGASRLGDVLRGAKPADGDTGPTRRRFGRDGAPPPPDAGRPGDPAAARGDDAPRHGTPAGPDGPPRAGTGMPPGGGRRPDGPARDGRPADGDPARRRGPLPRLGPRTDGPRADGPRGDGPRGDAPRGDAPRVDGPRSDGPRADGPRADGPRVDGPRTDGVRADGATGGADGFRGGPPGGRRIGLPGPGRRPARPGGPADTAGGPQTTSGQLSGGVPPVGPGIGRPGPGGPAVPAARRATAAMPAAPGQAPTVPVPVGPGLVPGGPPGGPGGPGLAPGGPGAGPGGPAMPGAMPDARVKGPGPRPNRSLPVDDAPTAITPTALPPRGPDGPPRGPDAPARPDAGPLRADAPLRDLDGSLPGLDEADDGPAGGDRAEIRFANQVHVRTPKSVMVAVAVVVIALLGVLPTYLVWQGGVHNPAFAAMDRLAVPSWASRSPVDHTSGDRWCVQNCLRSERTATSTHNPAETLGAYARALRAAGWTPAPGDRCGKLGPAGSCWVLDQSEMVVTVSVAPCAIALPSNETDLPRDASPGPVGDLPPGCAPTIVSLMITNQVEMRKP